MFKGIDDFSNLGMNACKLSGLTMTVVVDRQVVYKKGFGYRDFKKVTMILC